MKPENLLNTAKDDNYFMAEALKLAKEAFEIDEVPVGAIIVHDGKIIARAHNQIEMLKDATAHAEMIALTQASEFLQTWRLTDTVIYVTLEPCLMCAGALLAGRVKRLCYGPRDPKKGAIRSIARALDNPRHNHRIEVTEGVMENESSQLLKEFFLKLRSDKN